MFLLSVVTALVSVILTLYYIRVPARTVKDGRNIHHVSFIGKFLFPYFMFNPFSRNPELYGDLER